MAHLTRNAIDSSFVFRASGKCSRYLLLCTTIIILTACGGTSGQGTEEIRIFGLRLEVNMEDPGKSGEYVYDPAEFTFERGQQVTFFMTSEGEFHTFTVPDLDIDVHVDAWKTKALTFTFDEPGTYELVCTPHETLGMTGVITVR